MFDTKEIRNNYPFLLNQLDLHITRKEGLKRSFLNAEFWREIIFDCDATEIINLMTRNYDRQFQDIHNLVEGKEDKTS